MSAARDSRWIKIPLRLVAILLILAAVCFAIKGFHSFHTKEYPLSDAGSTIEHGFANANVGRAPSPLVQPGPVIRELPLANRDFLDFMISDVCLDINGNVTGGDPGHCATHRDLKVGEAVPYLKRIYSFPIRGLDGKTLVAVWQDTLAADKEASLREFFVNEKAGDALEAISLGTTYSSIVYTQAGKPINPKTNLPEPFLYWDNKEACEEENVASIICATPWLINTDSWRIIPYELTRGGPGIFTRYGYKARELGKKECRANESPGLLVADWFTSPFDFGDNTPLETIITRNWGRQSPNPFQNESFFWTREHGYTRHEAWWRADFCTTGTPPGDNPNRKFPIAACTDAGNPTNPANPQAGAPCTGPYKVFAFGAWYWRQACENAPDNFRVASAPLHSFVLPLPSDIREESNFLVNGDWAGFVTTPWGKTGSTNWAWKLIAETNNNRVAFSCIGTCSGNSIYNDGSFSKLQNAGNRHVQAGALLKGSPGAWGTLTVHAIAVSGVEYGAFSLNVTHDGKDHLVEFNFPVNFTGSAQPTWFRFEFVPRTTGAQYELDEAYVVGFAN